MIRGNVTVVLALILSLIMSLFITLVGGVRNNAVWGKANIVAQAGMDSIFAEFNKELLNQYELFYIDTTYAESVGGIGETLYRLEEYVEANIDKTKGKWYLPSRNFTKLKTKSTELIAYQIASDSYGESIKEQAISAYESKYGGAIIEQIIDNHELIKTYELDGKDMVKEQEELIKQLDSDVEDSESDKLERDEEKTKNVFGVVPEEYVIAPIDLTEKYKSQIGKIKEASIDIYSTTYYRELEEGVYSKEREKKDFNIVEEVVFNEYLLDKCSCYMDELEKSNMSYQVEYMITGYASNKDNFNAFLNRIFGIRMVDNYLQIIKNQTIVDATKVAAAAIAALIYMPSLEPVITQIILIYMAYDQSDKDMKIILKGGSVSLTSESGPKLGYKDYLRAFLLITNSKKKICRFMDIVEDDIRYTTNNSDFQLDRCVDFLNVEFIFSSEYGENIIFNKEKKYME